MTYDIELFFPTALSGASNQTESLGECKILTHGVFLTITDQNGEARLEPLDEVAEVDRTQHRYTNVFGKAFYPRQIDFPSKIYVEVGSGHARAINGDQIARMVRSKHDQPGKGVSW